MGFSECTPVALHIVITLQLWLFSLHMTIPSLQVYIHSDPHWLSERLLTICPSDHSNTEQVALIRNINSGSDK